MSLPCFNLTITFCRNCPITRIKLFVAARVAFVSAAVKRRGPFLQKKNSTVEAKVADFHL